MTSTHEKCSEKGNANAYIDIKLFSQSSRFLRPVQYLPLERLDLVSPFEQPFMSIACTTPEVQPQDTHVELDPTNILSIVANQTPFSGTLEGSFLYAEDCVQKSLFETDHVKACPLATGCFFAKDSSKEW